LALASRRGRSYRHPAFDGGGLGPLLEDAVHGGGLFGAASAEVPSGGPDGGLAEERLDLGGVGAADLVANGGKLPDGIPETACNQLARPCAETLMD
jgi:hypothetical protein